MTRKALEVFLTRSSIALGAAKLIGVAQ